MSWPSALLWVWSVPSVRVKILETQVYGVQPFDITTRVAACSLLTIAAKHGIRPTNFVPPKPSASLSWPPCRPGGMHSRFDTTSSIQGATSG